MTLTILDDHPRLLEDEERLQALLAAASPLWENNQKTATLFNFSLVFFLPLTRGNKRTLSFKNKKKRRVKTFGLDHLRRGQQEEKAPVEQRLHQHLRVRGKTSIVTTPTPVVVHTHDQ